MGRSDRLIQRIQELERDWKQLTKRIEAVREELSVTLDREHRITLEERLRQLVSERATKEAELNPLEQELQRLVSSRGRQRVFISYKRSAETDRTLAMYLARFFDDHGKQVFIDQKMKVGMDWINEIHDQIAQSDFLVVLLSRESMNSDMVLEEVQFADLQRRETGRPRTLPLRLAYEGALPYRLEEYLRPLQYALWTSEADTSMVAQRLVNAMEGYETLERGSDAAINSTDLYVVSRNIIQDKPIVEPLSYSDPRLILEVPGGVVDLESRFYVERPADLRLRRELDRPGSLAYIRAARQMGKTSLLVRGVDYAQKRGSLIIFLDFQTIDISYLQQLDTFLHYIAFNIATTLKIDYDKVEVAWRIPLSPKDRLTHFVEDYVLRKADVPIVLAIDEADRLYESSFRQEFFGLIRAWSSKHAVNSIWKKLNIAMVISTQPYLLIDDINQSPFNVGLRIELEDFTPAQVAELNKRHGAPLSEAECQATVQLLGGHPYLVRQALYTLIDSELSWNELVEIAPKETGPFGMHLRQYLWLLRDKPQLIAALRSILSTGTSADEMALIRLAAAGLVRQDGNGRARCRCQLYELYFKRHLL